MTDFNTWKLVDTCLILKREQWRIIDFDHCNSSAELLDWIFHNFSKGLTKEETYDLISALKVILSPCENYCSYGLGKQANGKQLAKKYLRS